MIYISALTTINLDDHNRIRTTDARLLRRMVRDSLFRGTLPDETMDMWDSVRAGEEKYIFPYQEQRGRDVQFLAERTSWPFSKSTPTPCSAHISPESRNYTLARRLVKFLNYVHTADVENEIPRQLHPARIHRRLLFLSILGLNFRRLRIIAHAREV